MVTFVNGGSYVDGNKQVWGNCAKIPGGFRLFRPLRYRDYDSGGVCIADYVNGQKSGWQDIPTSYNIVGEHDGLNGQTDQGNAPEPQADQADGGVRGADPSHSEDGPTRSDGN